jgi:hypothetical protein
MNEENFNLSVRQLLKQFGITAQREIEKSVDGAIKAGRLKGTETLRGTASLRVEGLDADIVVEGPITLA